MVDAICLGELLVDWVCTTAGAELADASTFTKAPGGAPANTAVGLARQGIETAFVGRVSKDEFGRWLKSVLKENGINVDCTIEDAKAQTRMAYVVTTASGDRKLADFTRIACADARLEPQDLDGKMFETASVLHFGSISLIQEPSRSATLRAIELAASHGCLISYDPNVRLSLWPDEAACREAILSTLGKADVVKINESELEFLTGKTELTEAEKLRARFELPILIVTLDARGAFVATESQSRTVAGFKIDLVEATGAGDGFNAGIIQGLINRLADRKVDKNEMLVSLTKSDLDDILKRANAIGAVACTKAGAIPALPTSKELAEFLKEHTREAVS